IYANALSAGGHSHPVRPYNEHTKFTKGILMTRDHVSLTIYNHGTSLVRERRTISLQPGLNTLDITDVTALIDATSVTFQAAENVAVLEQNYLYDLVGGDALLRRYLEQTIEITTEDG